MAVWGPEPSKLRVEKKRAALPEPTERLHYLVVDPHTLSREGLSRLLADSFHGAKIAQSASIPVSRHDVPSVDAVLIVVAQGPQAAHDALSKLAASGLLIAKVPVILLSDAWQLLTVRHALAQGVRGCVSLTSNSKIVVAAIRFVAEGGLYIPPEVLGCVESGSGSEPARSMHVERAQQGPYFTPQERRVLAALLEGKSNKRIARALELCESTVKVHVRHIMRKLGVTNRTQVALLVDRSRAAGPKDAEPFRAADA